MKNKFLADENIPSDVIEILRTNLSVFSVSELNPGIDDNEIMDLSISTKSIILTLDRDFTDLIFREKLVCYGIIYIRSNYRDPVSLGNALLLYLSNAKENFIGSLTVIKFPNLNIRQRKFSTPFKLALKKIVIAAHTIHLHLKSN